MGDAEARRWLELAVRCPPDDESRGLVAEALMALGGRVVEEREGWLFTHIAEPEDAAGFEDRARARVAEITGGAVPELRARLLDHQDWAEAWKRGLRPRRVTSRLVVTPSWMKADAGEGDLVIVLDPGMAFGTAEHGTTRGCLRLLDRALSRGDRIVDVGAGSGILSIAAAFLGASSVTALEGDPLACEALAENLARNGVLETVGWEELWADAETLGRRGPLDGIVANIESGVLRGLLEGFGEAVAAGGWLILGGIQAHEWDGMAAETEARGFRLVSVDADGDWRSGLFRRRGGAETRAPGAPP